MPWVLYPQSIEDGVLDGEIGLGHKVAAALRARLCAAAAYPAGEAIHDYATGLVRAEPRDLLRAPAAPGCREVDHPPLHALRRAHPPPPERAGQHELCGGDQ